MRTTLFLLFTCLSTIGYGQKQPKDWLINNTEFEAKIEITNQGKDIVLTNGLLKRVLRIQPNVACTSFENLTNGQQLLRSVKPEAILIVGEKKINIGGLYNQKEMAYLSPNWIDSFTAEAKDFVLKNYFISDIKPFINWQKAFWTKRTPKFGGKMLTMLFTGKAIEGLEVTVNYEVYDGIPLIIKWLSIKNNSNHIQTINRIINENLAVVEEESAVVGSPQQMKKQHGIYIETNYAYNNSMRYELSDYTTHWIPDSTYTSQVNYDYLTPCLLQVYPEKVTAIALNPGETLNSVRTHELLIDSYDRERRGLAIRKLYATVAPWSCENPIFMHLVSANDEQVITAIDQCQETGYEALILSFGSHCNIEDTSAINISKWKKLADYAHSKGIAIGGYSLLSSRRISDNDDVIDPITGKPDKGAYFGHAPCLGSNWGLTYVAKLKYFFAKTGFNIFENDGTYPGDVCASTTHPGHINLGDSQWKQMNMQKELYHWCREHGIYVNAPDWYYLDGSNKSALGYREVNFSLSRDQQKVLNRQNIYDATWEKTPSMGWGFVPLTRYQGGNEDAILEPLEEHLSDYKQLMMQYYGAGVQACYRGPRLFDTDKTKQMVTDVINWYKKHREILNADIIHLRRADGRDWDGILHVDPTGKEKGLLMLFNPLKEPITRIISIPVYYTGLHKKVKIIDESGKKQTLTVNRDYTIELKTTIPSNDYLWFVLE